MFNKKEIKYIEDMTQFYLEGDFDNSKTAKEAKKVYQSILAKCNETT